MRVDCKYLHHDGLSNECNDCFSKKFDFNFRTALHFAAEEGKLEVTKFLVDFGANVNATDNDGKTPYDLAVQGREEEVAEYLKGLTQSD